MIPDDRLYTKNHAWVKQAAAVLEVGVTEPLLRKLGLLISIELPDADDELKAELPFGEIEGSDETFQLYPPLEGRVVEVNEELVWNQKKLLKDPYGEGWLLKVRPHDPEAAKHLWSAPIYRKFCEGNLGERFVR